MLGALLSAPGGLFARAAPAAADGSRLSLSFACAFMYARVPAGGFKSARIARMRPVQVLRRTIRRGHERDLCAMRKTYSLSRSVLLAAGAIALAGCGSQREERASESLESEEVGEGGGAIEGIDEPAPPIDVPPEGQPSPTSDAFVDDPGEN